MSMEKQPMNDEQMEQVSGGLRKFNRKKQILTYTRADGGVEEHKILDYDKAWEMSCSLDGRMSEDQIIQKLINMRYIQ